MHAQWEILLDEEFQEAWEHGIVIECCDGVKRRFYPRFFTYSADYPEKYVQSLLLSLKPLDSSLPSRILLAGIRNLGRCPCPRCLVPLSQIHNIGTARDMLIRSNSLRIDDAKRKSVISSARRIIYDRCHSVKSTAVEELLKPLSLVPNKVCRDTDLTCRSELPNNI
jgi:hypothetical protein